MEEKQKKQEEKQKKQEEKQKKQEEKQNNDENIIITINHVIPIELDYSRCISILKTGINKGKQCSHKIYEKQLCKKHFLMQKNDNN